MDELPTTEKLRLSILELLLQRPLASSQLQDEIAPQLGLTEEQRRKKRPNSASNQSEFGNRFAFALKDLVDAKLIFPKKESSAAREITPKGRKFMRNPPDRITNEILKQLRAEEELDPSRSTAPDISKTSMEPEKPAATPNAMAHPEPIKSEPTNLILYGPPGTGKTFTTRGEAVRLCGYPGLEGGELKRRYNTLVEAGQIAFVTFHQNYSYEDFVEGLRPPTGEEGEDQPGFRLKPRRGIFREISALAEEARKSAGRAGGFDIGGRQVFKMSLGRAGVDDPIFDAAIEGNYVVSGWGGNIDWSDARYDGDAGISAIRATWSEVDPGTSGNSGNVSQLWRFRSSMREGDLVVISRGLSHFRAIGEITSSYRYEPTGTRDYNHRRTVRWLLVPDEPLPVDTIYDKPFTMLSCYRLQDSHLKREALARLLPGVAVVAHAAPDQFVLIIDEINRANVSKVFGELITLLEPDKRIGADNELKVKLPYSSEIFGVPPNLHVIGTMNTADRSIAPLDTALRRRFEFREIMPDLNHLLEDVGGVPLRTVLRIINGRIEYLFDREHQIGHAYLMGCKDKAAIDAVFRGKVIPLLTEYFYDDWNKVALVLGDADGQGGFLDRIPLKAPPASATDGEVRERYRWTVRNRFADDAYKRFQ